MCDWKPDFDTLNTRVDAIDRIKERLGADE